MRSNPREALLRRSHSHEELVRSLVSPGVQRQPLSSTDIRAAQLPDGHLQGHPGPWKVKNNADPAFTAAAQSSKRSGAPHPLLWGILAPACWSQSHPWKGHVTAATDNSSVPLCQWEREGLALTL